MQPWVPPTNLDVPASATRCPPPRLHNARDTWWRKEENYGRESCLNDDFHANLRHGKIFSLLKIRRLRPGLKPRTWVLKASTLTPRPPKPLRTLHTVDTLNTVHTVHMYVLYLSFILYVRYILYILYVLFILYILYILCILVLLISVLVSSSKIVPFMG